MSGKQRAVARARVKNAARLAKRKGKVPGWMRGQPMPIKGNGGTDKSGSRKRSIVYYSDKDAMDWTRPKK